ncbi:hypothetical protein GTY57_16325 [Streptomyces sp. SID5475]|nr:hypothetical protein [Streptomyces sp. SID5475]
MRRLLVWSALRYWGRRLAAAAVAAPVGVLGIPSTWLGRKLGWSWLMYPGRRLFWRLSNTAHAARLARDAAIRQAFDAEAEQAEQDNEHDARPVAATVPRAPRHHNARTATTGDGMSDTTPGGPGFLFHEAAAEMEAAAQSYDPDGMMHVLATCEGMPYAVQSFANTFRILAERSDDEFPLEKEVGAALNEVYALLMQAVDAAAEVVTVFRNVHDQDIARHEDPRNNAEDKWDTTNN